MDTIFLNAGELLFSKEPIIMKTILGSCVSVVIFDKKNKYGGMCHYIIPEISRGTNSVRFGDVAVPFLIKKFLNNGSLKPNMEVSIFGGAFMLDIEDTIFFTGENNIRIAHTYINKYKLFIKQEDTGGNKGRKIQFNSLTGEIISSYINDN